MFEEDFEAWEAYPEYRCIHNKMELKLKSNAKYNYWFTFYKILYRSSH